jgi:hypothetical protein
MPVEAVRDEETEPAVTLHFMNNKITDTLLGGRSPKLGEPRKSLFLICHMFCCEMNESAAY